MSPKPAKAAVAVIAAIIVSRITERIAGRSAVIENVPAPPSEPKVTFANVEKARRLLDYAPSTSLPEGLERFWDWRRKEAASETA